MPPFVVEAMAAVSSIALLGTFALIGMRMRWKHKETLAQGSSEDMDRLAEAVDTLTEQVDVLTAENQDIQERLDFAERLLANPRGEPTEIKGDRQ